jgi:hypothetical protein
VKFLDVWTVVALGALVMAVSCDDEPPPDSLGSVCVPGMVQRCYGPGRCPGVQECLDTGEGFGPCNCGATPDAGPAAPTPVCSPGELRVCSGEACGGVQLCDDTGSFGACDCSSRLLVVNVLGAPCSSDAECGPELGCWLSAAESLGPFLGGAAHGYCTRACTVLEECTRFDPIGVCSPPGAGGLGACLRGCQSKNPAPGEGKCLDRPDQICLSAAALGAAAYDPATRQLGACLPSCGSDLDCDAGRVCDLSTGLCVSTAAPGLPIGAACSLDTDCAGGVCSTFASGASTCSAPCPLDTLGCGYATDANPRGAACLAPWFNEGGVTEGQQDLGLCVELCSETADCAQEGFVCDTSQGGPPGSAGACLPEAEVVSGDIGADAG